MLLYVIVATVCCLFVEMQRRNAIIPALTRVYLALLQGFWFLQVLNQFVCLLVLFGRQFFFKDCIYFVSTEGFRKMGFR